MGLESIDSIFDATYIYNTFRRGEWVYVHRPDVKLQALVSDT